jgi:hypothetical protein
MQTGYFVSKDSADAGGPPNIVPAPMINQTSPRISDTAAELRANYTLK